MLSIMFNGSCQFSTSKLSWSVYRANFLQIAFFLYNIHHPSISSVFFYYLSQWSRIVPFFLELLDWPKSLPYTNFMDLRFIVILINLEALPRVYCQKKHYLTPGRALCRLLLLWRKKVHLIIPRHCKWALHYLFGHGIMPFGSVIRKYWS